MVSIKVKSQVLSQQFGWPLACAEGYVDGEAYRRRHKDPLPPHLLVGIDEYAQGFRAGYYGRSPSFRSAPGTPEA